MSHNQSRQTPEKIPPRRNTTRMLPKAFCSGPCNKIKKKNYSYIDDMHNLRYLKKKKYHVALGGGGENADGEVSIGETEERDEHYHPALVGVFCREIESRYEQNPRQNRNHESFS